MYIYKSVKLLQFYIRVNNNTLYHQVLLKYIRAQKLNKAY